MEKNLGDKNLPKTDVILYLQDVADEAFLKKWKLQGSVKVCRKQRNCHVLAAAYKVTNQSRIVHK